MHKTWSTLCKWPLHSLSYDLYSVLDNQKASKNSFQATTFKVEENSSSFQGLEQKFKDFSRTSPKLQGLFKTVRTLVAVVSIKRKRLTVMQASNYLTAKFSIIWMTWWKFTAFAMGKLRVLSNTVTVKYGCEYIQQFCYINRCLRLTKKSTFPNFV